MPDDTARISLQEIGGHHYDDFATVHATFEGVVNLMTGDLSVTKQRPHRHAVAQRPDEIAPGYVIGVGDDLYRRVPGRQWSVCPGTRPGSLFDVPTRLARMDGATLTRLGQDRVQGQVATAYTVGSPPTAGPRIIIWLDDAGRLVRLDVSGTSPDRPQPRGRRTRPVLHVDQPGRRLELWDHGVPVDIRVPPNAVESPHPWV